MNSKATDPSSRADSAGWTGEQPHDGGWVSGTMTNRPALHAVVDADLDIIEIVDSSGPLLSLTFDEAQAVVGQIQDLLAVWPRTVTR